MIAVETIFIQGEFIPIDFEENKNWTIQLQLDDVDEPELYPSRYNAVLRYADKTCPLYSGFRLPAQLVSNPVNEKATSSGSKNCKKYI